MATRELKATKNLPSAVTINGQRIKQKTIRMMVETIFPKPPELTKEERAIHDLDDEIVEKISKATSIAEMAWDRACDHDELVAPAMQALRDMLRDVEKIYDQLRDLQRATASGARQ